MCIISKTQGNPTSTKINKAGSDFYLPKTDRVPGTFDPNRSGIAKLGPPIRPSIPGENGHSGPMDCLAYSSTQHATLLTPGTTPKRDGTRAHGLHARDHPSSSSH